jgi:hypothetical protein
MLPLLSVYELQAEKNELTDGVNIGKTGFLCQGKKCLNLSWFWVVKCQGPAYYTARPRF